MFSSSQHSWKLRLTILLCYSSAGCGRWCLGTRAGEEQMHHPLLLPLLWGQISWGDMEGQQPLEPAQQKSPGHSESVFWIIRVECYSFSIMHILRQIPVPVKRCLWNSLLEKGQTTDVPITIINHCWRVSTQPGGTWLTQTRAITIKQSRIHRAGFNGCRSAWQWTGFAAFDWWWTGCVSFN